MTERKESRYVTYGLFVKAILSLIGTAILAGTFTMSQIDHKADKSDVCYIRGRVDQIYNILLRERHENNNR